jgi:hypothetical protein
MQSSGCRGATRARWPCRIRLRFLEMASDDATHGQLSLDALREFPHGAQLALGKASTSVVQSVLARVIRRSFELGVIAAQIYRDPGRSVELVGGLADDDSASMGAIAAELEAIKVTLDATIEKDIVEAKRALGRVPGLVQRGSIKRAEDELVDARTAALAYADTNRVRDHPHSSAVGYWIAAEAALYLNDVDEADDHCSAAIEQARLAYGSALQEAAVSRSGVVTLDRKVAAKIDTADLALAGVSNILSGLGRPLPDRLEFGQESLPEAKPALHKRVVAKVHIKELAPAVRRELKRLPRPRRK